MIKITFSGADLGFPIGGGADPAGCANIQFCQIFQKLDEIENILGHKWAHVGAPQDLSMPFH